MKSSSSILPITDRVACKAIRMCKCRTEVAAQCCLERLKDAILSCSGWLITAAFFGRAAHSSATCCRSCVNVLCWTCIMTTQNYYSFSDRERCFS